MRVIFFIEIIAVTASRLLTLPTITSIKIIVLCFGAYLFSGTNIIHHLYAKEVVRPRHFLLNEDMIRDVSAPGEAEPCDPYSVLYDLFRQISPKATVYPSENYYYFAFYRGGDSYSGSLRLSAGTRDEGILEFACYKTITSWHKTALSDTVIKYLKKSDGLVLRKENRFAYSASFRGIKVEFLLNRINQDPKNIPLAADEEFVGRLLDDSGVMFALIYNRPQKVFYYILDENGEAHEPLTAIRNNAYISARTGFVYARDDLLHRYILFAVNAQEMFDNTPYDGPFDQLPENYFAELKFWSFVFDSNPRLAGEISKNGEFFGLKPPIIYGVVAYRQYILKEDMDFIDACVRKHADRPGRLLCLTKG